MTLFLKRIICGTDCIVSLTLLGWHLSYLVRYNPVRCYIHTGKKLFAAPAEPFDMCCLNYMVCMFRPKLTSLENTSVTMESQMTGIQRLFAGYNLLLFLVEYVNKSGCFHQHPYPSHYNLSTKENSTTDKCKDHGTDFRAIHSMHHGPLSSLQIALPAGHVLPSSVVDPAKTSPYPPVFHLPMPFQLQFVTSGQLP